MLDQRILQGIALAHAGKTLVFGALDATFDAIVKQRAAELAPIQEPHPRNVRGLR